MLSAVFTEKSTCVSDLEAILLLGHPLVQVLLLLLPVLQDGRGLQPANTAPFERRVGRRRRHQLVQAGLTVRAGEAEVAVVVWEATTSGRDDGQGWAVFR